MNCSFPDSPHIINVLCNFMIHDSEKNIVKILRLKEECFKMVIYK